MRRLLFAVLMVGLVAGCGSSPARLPPQGDPQRAVPALEVMSVIRTVIADGREPSLGPLTAGDRAQLATLYSANAPLWIDAAGRPSRDAREAMGLLDRAADDGLDPADYAAPVLHRLAAALTATGEATDIAVFDVAVSANTLRYLHQLHKGRVDPRTIGFYLDVPADHDDVVSALSAALAAHRVAESAAGLAPSFAGYRALRTMLARYRSLAADPSLEPLPPIGVTVHPGEPYAGLRALQRRLVAFDDMPADVSVPDEPSAYEGALVEGVKHFQARHGLQADGVLGQGTQGALRVPLEWRVRQIELALERLRWLPDPGDGRLVAVNIPMFRLWGWDSAASNDTPAVSMGAIVGRALNTRTPVFAADMRYLIFRPYWDVPASILRHEILPAVERDPQYFERQDLEIVSGPGDNAQPVALTAESLAGLRRGTLRVRQRPGPKNSLGLVKFVFPNVDNIYMHGTPAMQLFNRPRRDFSHGCVRLENALALAEWALGDQPAWTRDRILAAMNADRPSRVDLARSIRVLLFYMTAAVMPEDGTIHFAEDIYGEDATLDHALASLRPVLGVRPIQ